MYKYNSYISGIIILSILSAILLAFAFPPLNLFQYSFIALTDIWNIICGNENVSLLSRKVFFTLRVPRTFMAIMAGAGLGLAGSVYQIIFKNPLASPDIIGIAGGANLGAALAIVVLTSSGMMEIAMGSFIGGFLAVLAVMFLVRATRSRATATYVLAGIVINAVSKAVIMGLKYFADPENELAAMEYWEMGTLGNTTAAKVMTVFPLFCVGVIGIILLRRQIEMLALSDNDAGHWGCVLELCVPLYYYYQHFLLQLLYVLQDLFHL